MPEDDYVAGNRAHYRERMRTAAQRMWLTMGKCEWCGALPKMPCRDKESIGQGIKIMSRPHKGRPKLEEK